jgi:deoxycytidylate deaminase
MQLFTQNKQSFRNVQAIHVRTIAQLGHYALRFIHAETNSILERMRDLQMSGIENAAAASEACNVQSS